MSIRMKPEARKEDILAAALGLAEEHGYNKISRSQIAKAANVTGPILNYHFGTMTKFRRDLMRYAVRLGNLKVIAQGLCSGDVHAQKADEDVKRKALDALM